MTLATSFLILWLSLGGGLAQSDTSPDAEESYSDWGLRHIRGSFESVNSYFDSFLELLGGKNGVCQYRCRYGVPDSATKNIGHPVKSEFQINNQDFVKICEIFGTHL
ncbi:Group XIIB secretory phospholipase A2-like protein, partial [Eschrichtius robustus]|nr:Group XIIB secretory phospholipase A2-like protein [Eschrichtius robustus]